GHGFFHRRAHFAGHELVLGLTAEFGLGHLDRQHAHQAFAHVIAGGVHLGALGQLVVGDVLVDDARHRRPQAGKVGAAIALRDVVREAQHGFGVAVVPLHGDVHANGRVAHRGLGGHREDVVVQNRLAAVDVLHETLHAAQEGKVFFLDLTLVDQANFHAVVQEGQFAQALGQDVVMEIDVLEDFRIRQEVHRRAGLIGFTRHGQGRDPFATAEFHLVHLAGTLDGQAQPFRKRVHAGHAHAVQPPGHLVGVVVELAAGVQFGHDDFRGTALVFVVLVDVGGNAAAVVADGNAVVGVNGHDDVVAIPGQRF